MCEQTPLEYKDGDIVWVKMGPCWWPGEVKDWETVPAELSDSYKKKPIAAVKFFKEDSYEIVKNINQIYSYNCKRKDEFIRKGLEMHRKENPFMKKFPTDISTAEERTGGDPNIISSPMFAPEKRLNYTALIFGNSSKKSPKGDKKRQSTKGSPSHTATSGALVRRSLQNITHPRFLGNDDHEVRILLQSPEENKSEETSSIYSCTTCGFSTPRVDVIVLHNKSHIQGVYSTPILTSKKGKRSPAKKEKKEMKMTHSKTSSIDEDLALLEKGLPLPIDSSGDEIEEEPKVKKRRKTQTSEKRKKKKSETKEEVKVDICKNLLAEWDDEENDEDLDTSTETEKEKENKTDNKNNKNSENREIREKENQQKDSSKSCFDFDEEEDELLSSAVIGKIQRPSASEKQRKAEYYLDIKDVIGVPSEYQFGETTSKEEEIRELPQKQQNETAEEVNIEHEPAVEANKDLEHERLESLRGLAEKLSPAEPMSTSCSDIFETESAKSSQSNNEQITGIENESTTTSSKSLEVSEIEKETSRHQKKDVMPKSPERESPISDEKSSVVSEEETATKCEKKESPKSENKVPTKHTERKHKRSERLRSKSIEEQISESPEKQRSQSPTLEAYKEILASTSVPTLPEIPQTIKCEQNFPSAKMKKIPDKEDQSSSESQTRTHTEVITKHTNPKKRFVKTFEDSELNEKKKTEEAEAKLKGLENEKSGDNKDVPGIKTNQEEDKRNNSLESKEKTISSSDSIEEEKSKVVVSPQDVKIPANEPSEVIDSTSSKKSKPEETKSLEVLKLKSQLMMKLNENSNIGKDQLQGIVPKYKKFELIRMSPRRVSAQKEILEKKTDILEKKPDILEKKTEILEKKTEKKEEMISPEGRSEVETFMQNQSSNLSPSFSKSTDVPVLKTIEITSKHHGELDITVAKMDNNNSATKLSKADAVYNKKYFYTRRQGRYSVKLKKDVSNPVLVVEKNEHNLPNEIQPLHAEKVKLPKVDKIAHLIEEKATQNLKLSETIPHTSISRKGFKNRRGALAKETEKVDEFSNDKVGLDNSDLLASRLSTDETLQSEKSERVDTSDKFLSSSSPKIDDVADNRLAEGSEGVIIENTDAVVETQKEVLNATTRVDDRTDENENLDIQEENNIQPRATESSKSGCENLKSSCDLDMNRKEVNENIEEILSEDLKKQSSKGSQSEEIKNEPGNSMDTIMENSRKENEDFNDESLEKCDKKSHEKHRKSSKSKRSSSRKSKRHHKKDRKESNIDANEKTATEQKIKIDAPKEDDLGSHVIQESSGNVETPVKNIKPQQKEDELEEYIDVISVIPKKKKIFKEMDHKKSDIFLEPTYFACTTSLTSVRDTNQGKIDEVQMGIEGPEEASNDIKNIVNNELKDETSTESLGLISIDKHNLGLSTVSTFEEMAKNVNEAYHKKLREDEEKEDETVIVDVCSLTETKANETKENLHQQTNEKVETSIIEGKNDNSVSVITKTDDDREKTMQEKQNEEKESVWRTGDKGDDILKETNMEIEEFPEQKTEESDMSNLKTNEKPHTLQESTIYTSEEKSEVVESESLHTLQENADKNEEESEVSQDEKTHPLQENTDTNEEKSEVTQDEKTHPLQENTDTNEEKSEVTQDEKTHPLQENTDTNEEKSEVKQDEKTHPLQENTDTDEEKSEVTQDEKTHPLQENTDTNEEKSEVIDDKRSHILQESTDTNEGKSEVTKDKGLETLQNNMDTNEEKSDETEQKLLPTESCTISKEEIYALEEFTKERRGPTTMQQFSQDFDFNETDSEFKDKRSEQKPDFDQNTIKKSDEKFNDTTNIVEEICKDFDDDSQEETQQSFSTKVARTTSEEPLPNDENSVKTVENPDFCQEIEDLKSAKEEACNLPNSDDKNEILPSGIAKNIENRTLEETEKVIASVFVSTKEQGKEELSALSTLAAVSELSPPLEEQSSIEKITNLTVVSETDLEHGQVEIVNTPESKPVTLTNFSVDFTETKEDDEPSKQKLQVESSNTEIPPDEVPSAVLDETKESNTQSALKTGGCDLEEQIPSLIVCNKDNATQMQMQKGKEPEQAMTSSKLLEILTDNSKSTLKTSEVSSNDATTTALSAKIQTPVIAKDSKHLQENVLRPDIKNTKFVVKSALAERRASGTKSTKPVILSEKIIKPVSESEVVSVQKVTSKRTHQDIEDIDTFIIQKPTKKIASDSDSITKPQTSAGTPATIKKTVITPKGRGKAKILQQTIITPSGDVIQPAVTQAQTEDTMFDINSMPIVLGDQILTPESIENMPVVISEAAPVSSKSLAEKSVPKKVAIAQQPKILNKVPGTPTSQPTIIRTYTAAQKLTKGQRNYQVASSRIIKSSSGISSQPSKQGKFIIVPSSTVAGSSKTIIGKRPLLKQSSSSHAAPASADTSEPVGNKIMIVTNQQGQQQRVLLTPAQQKMLGYQSPGTKLAKAAIKGNIMAKTSKAVMVTSSNSPNIVAQAIVNSKAQIISGNQSFISSGGQILVPISQTKQKLTKPDGAKVGKKLQLPSQKVRLQESIPSKSSTPTQKTIVIKNQQGQIVKKIQGTDDALLEQQVQEQVQAIKASSSFSSLKHQKSENIQKVVKTPVRRSYPKKLITSDPAHKPLTTNLSSHEIPPLAPISPSSSKKVESHLLSTKPDEVKVEHPISTAEEKPKEQRPLNQLIIQDALGNQTTITEGQILALPSETVDGQPQSYMLVTLDESGNLTPLNNEALLSLDPNLGIGGGDLSNMVLQFDERGTTASVAPPEKKEKVLTDKSKPELAKPQLLEEQSSKILVHASQPNQVPISTKPTEVAAPEPTLSMPTIESPQVGVERGHTITCSVNTDSNQQLIISGDPISTQKFIESLTEGNPDLANLLASAEGNILIHTDGQQILINTESENQLLLPVNAGNIAAVESTEGGGNPIFATQSNKSQDILAAALADTDVFQHDQPPVQPKLPQSQLSPNSTLFPMNVGNVLETSLTLSSPIMTPLEVPSSNSKKIPDEESDILTTEVPKNVDLPITITDPNISQTVAQQQVATLMAAELRNNLDLPLSIADGGVTATSSEINSPSYGYSLPTLDDTVGLGQKTYSGSISMPLLNEDTDVTSTKAERSVKLPGAKDEMDAEITADKNGRDSPKENEKIGMEDNKRTRSPVSSSFISSIEGGLCTLGGEMCSSLSEPPPDMFDLSSSYLSSEELRKDEKNIPEEQVDNDSCHSNLSREDENDLRSQFPRDNESSNHLPAETNNGVRFPPEIPKRNNFITDDSVLRESSPVTNIDENSSEIPVQPQIVTNLPEKDSDGAEESSNSENSILDSSKRKADDTFILPEEKKSKVD